MPVIFDTINRLTKNLNTLQAKLDQYEKDFFQLRESSGEAQKLINLFFVSSLIPYNSINISRV